MKNEIAKVNSKKSVTYNADEVMMTPELAERAEKIAEYMAAGGMSVPEHCQNNKPLCYAITLKALRWGMDPWDVASCTSEVRGNLMFEGKLVMAIINTSGRVKTNLNYKVDGQPGADDMSVTVIGTLVEEDEPRAVTMTYAQARTKAKGGGVSYQWKNDPEQMLCYRAARQWVRRHCPEVLMGVYTPDEFQNELADTPRQRPKKSIIDNINKKVRGEDVEQPEPAEVDDVVEADFEDVEDDEPAEVDEAPGIEPIVAFEIDDVKSDIAGAGTLNELRDIWQSYWPRIQESKKPVFAELVQAKDSRKAALGGE